MDYRELVLEDGQDAEKLQIALNELRPRTSVDSFHGRLFRNVELISMLFHLRHDREAEQ